MSDFFSKRSLLTDIHGILVHSTALMYLHIVAVIQSQFVIIATRHLYQRIFKLHLKRFIHEFFRIDVISILKVKRHHGNPVRFRHRTLHVYFFNQLLKLMFKLFSPTKMNMIFFFKIYNKRFYIICKTAQLVRCINGVMYQDCPFYSFNTLFFFFLVIIDSVHGENIDSHRIRASAELRKMILTAIYGVTIDYSSEKIVIALFDIF